MWRLSPPRYGGCKFRYGLFLSCACVWNSRDACRWRCRPKSRVFISDVDSYLGRALLHKFGPKKTVEIVGTVRSAVNVPPKVASAVEVRPARLCGLCCLSRARRFLSASSRMVVLTGVVGCAAALRRRGDPAHVAVQVGSGLAWELARSADVVVINIAEPNGDTRLVIDGNAVVVCIRGARRCLCVWLGTCALSIASRTSTPAVAVALPLLSWL